MLLTERDAQRHYENLRNEGWEDGFRQGKGEGIALGKEQGMCLGKEQGILLGKEQGQYLAQEQINQLVKRLIADNRLEELQDSTTDPILQRKLLEEYGIVTKP